jgi:hypothetical protein
LKQLDKVIGHRPTLLKQGVNESPHQVANPSAAIFGETWLKPHITEHFDLAEENRLAHPQNPPQRD